ncbi:anillin [Sabethes cyaneus]|uniref:anillin n=1 Tax=Sabethes cyaneus TaxID=53552 RepID=UPI00237DD5DC|nr:anillin [Sabethes cyaneus]
MSEPIDDPAVISIAIDIVRSSNILERAEKRAAALGITNVPKFPLSEFNYDATATASSSAAPKSPAKKPTLPEGAYTKQPTRNFGNTATTTSQSKNPMHQEGTGGSKVTKIETQLNPTSSSGKDVDVAVEINITTGSNVQVEVEVAECEIDANGKVTRKVDKTDDTDVKSLIRDSSRNQLQRLGTLYSESQDLSSPVHRTEGRFHEENTQGKENSRPKPKLAKLAMLADSINNWEDDTSHPDIKQHRDTLTVARKDKSPNRRQSPNKKESPKNTGATPKKRAPQPPKSILSPAKPSGMDSDKVGTKTLKWDQKVMDALELQGFQRRESTTSKLVYDYKDPSKQSQEKQETEQNEKALVPLKKSRAPDITDGSRERSSGQEIVKASTKKAEISKGLVSGRAAMFENSNSRQSILKNHKDPAEMSLKERLAIFEKNKGQALVPKSPFGIAPSIRQITGESSSSATIKYVPSCLPIQGTGIGTVPKEQPVAQKQKIDTYNKPVSAASTATGSAIKNTFAALMSNNSTISESQILEETRRQRQQEMAMLLNRFSKPTDMSSDALIEKPVPSPPPMPPAGYLTLSSKKAGRTDDAVSAGNKRRSGEEHVSPEVRSTLDDVKRIRIVAPKDGRLYPRLSDIETTTATESEGDDYTTATVSGEDESDRNQDTRYHDCYGEEEQEYDDELDQYGESVDEDDDSYMYSDEDPDLDTGICDVSLGQEIMQAVKMQDRRVSSGRRRQSHGTKIDQHQQSSTEHHQSVPSYQSQNSSTSEVSGVLDDMEDYLDEALDEDNGEEFDTPRKSSVSSNSFSYQKNPRKTNCQTINEEETEEKKDPQKPSPKQQQQMDSEQEQDYSSPVKSELKINPSDDNNMVTLVHTVSFYRRQQNSNNPTPVKKIVRTPVHPQRVAVESTTEDSDDATSTATGTSATSSDENDYLIQEKVKKLLDEVCKQQTVIAQTSQALNLCAATIEFSGSSESVEGERHLLVATHRRQAILDEVQRLRVEGCLRPPGAPTEKGRLTVKDITLPLKQEYIRKLASDTISGHHLVCLLKYNETVLATQTIPTLPGLLSVRFPDVLQLSNVFADFKVTMEIYGMTAQREILPHEIKYHIAMNKKGSSKLHTPKGVKSNTRLIMPPVQSPAGPQAVRSPALVQYGFIIFSLKEVQRTNWTLNPVAGVSPLEGTVHMKVNCELTVNVDYRGFLTMFEDVSGFGAWHRRWCRLQGHVLRYWTYPDDEKRKPPIGSIDLQHCCTQKVTIAPRLVCSRLNTLLLEFRRPAKPDDVESLVLEKQGNTVIQRHLLSADSKEERDEWCAHLNKTLALLKAWGQTDNRSTSC